MLAAFPFSLASESMVLSPSAPKPKTKGGIENSSVNRLKFTVPIAYRWAETWPFRYCSA